MLKPVTDETPVAMDKEASKSQLVARWHLDLAGA